jgi:hypothetical protein
MRTLKTAASAVALTLTAALATVPASDARAQDRDSFQVCWSIYAGWMPWGWIEDSGLMEKWADKYDISVEVVQINDYIESINQYTAGRFDGCAMTNMDALSIPAGGGVNTTALIVGDFSNGNDGIVLNIFCHGGIHSHKYPLTDLYKVSKGGVYPEEATFSYFCMTTNTDVATYINMIVYLTPVPQVIATPYHHIIANLDSWLYSLIF